MILNQTELEELVRETKVKLIEQGYNNDTESAHVNADNIICYFIEKLGYKEIVDLYNEVDKWYA